MISSIFRSALLLAACVAVVPAFAQSKSLKAGDGKQWFKGQTHTHTLWSDGDGAPELAVSWYKEQGYDFLSITDHNTMLRGDKWFIVDEKRLTAARLAELKEKFGEDWVETADAGGELVMRLKTYEELRKRFETPGEFILIEGEEITSKAHVNGINIREKVEASKGTTPAQVIREDFEAVEKQSKAHKVPMLAHLNHPNWGDGIPPEAMIEVDTSRFFEVYNGHGGVKNWGDAELFRVSTDRYWDIVLSVRLSANPANILYGVSTDDAHSYFERRAGSSIPGRGWCMVLCEKLDANSITQAFIDGDFYSSAGVLLDSVEWDDKEFRVDITSEPGVTYKTIFYGTKKGADVSSKPTLDSEGKEVPNVSRQYSDALGAVLLETDADPAVYPFKGDELYVRAKVVSSKLKIDPFKEGDFEMAWTQPSVRK
ncbi:MAG TPA: hypothetical protein PLJ47_14545 [Candidatus Hydrogenedentes bacterium]|nr:hypothetical protein [Candidatus Hydrogenedentota bacterium]HRK35813.1 hypothetical protein [Candidatus Hydrogenedentota bacterium]